MQSLPENCLGRLSAVCISQRLISQLLMKQFWTDWPFQILLQWYQIQIQSNIMEAWYSACKNYVLCVPECVGNCFIPTSNVNVDGVDMLAGAAILNFLKIYIQQTPVNALHYSVDNSLCYSWVSSLVHKRFLPKLSICRPNWYWPMFLVLCTIISWKRPTSKLPWKCTCRVGEMA